MVDVDFSPRRSDAANVATRWTSAMHYQFWDSQSANVIAVTLTQSEALALVRRRLADGWHPEHLTLGLHFDEGEEGAEVGGHLRWLTRRPCVPERRFR